MFAICHLFVGALAIGSSIAMPLVENIAVPKLIFEFSNTTYPGGIENIGIARSGHLLLNANEAPHTYMINPHEKRPTASLVATYPNALACLGIAEVRSNIFAVVAGNYTTTFEGVPGSFAIWLLDVTKPNHPNQKLLTKIPEAHALNGMTTITDSPNLILVADSELGAVWSIDVETGVYKKAITNPLLANSTQIPLGVNGIHVVDSTLYFTNTAQGLFGKVDITEEGMATGPVVRIAEDVAGDDYDDFVFDSYGNAFIANHPSTIVGVTRLGSQYVVANVSGPTSATFGKGAEANCVLYVPTIEGHVYSIDVC